MKSKMKICMIVQDVGTKGGISAVVNSYYGSNLEKDYDIVYISSYKDGTKITKVIKAVTAYLKFLKVMMTGHIDLVHIHSSFGPSFYRKIPFIYISRMMNKIIIDHVHGAEFDKFYTNASERKKRLVKKVWSKCDRILVLSSEWLHQYSSVVDLDKLRVVENYSVIQKQRNNHPCNNRVLFLGFVNDIKGCFDMPKVMSYISKENISLKLVIAGTGEVEKLKSMAEENGVSDYFEFVGWVRDAEKDKLLKESDILFLPSYAEGMPMAILDAMGYGLPIISTTVGGIPSIVCNGESGFLFSPGDCEGFAKAIIKLIKDDELRRSFGMKSYEIAKDKYTLEGHLKKIEAVYQEFVK